MNLLGAREYTTKPMVNSARGKISTAATTVPESPSGSEAVGVTARTWTRSPTTAPPTTGPVWRSTLSKEDAGLKSSVRRNDIPTVVRGEIR